MGLSDYGHSSFELMYMNIERPLLDRLRAVLAEVLPRTGIVNRLNLDDPLRGAGMDSMRMVMLISLLQEEFGFVVDEDDLREENFASLRALAAFVERKTAALPKAGSHPEAGPKSL
jgi:acyl carrier protein